MIEIGKNNIFTGSQSSISEIIKLNELIGINQIFFHKENSNLHHFLKIKKVKFKSKVEDKILNHLFRIDVIIIEDNDIYSLYPIRNITSLPIVIIQENYKILSNFTKFDKIYKFDIDRSKNRYFNPHISSIQFSEDRHIISELNSGWSCDLSLLKQQWIRDRKIEDIFKFD
jgi:hypothetical protein